MYISIAVMLNQMNTYQVLIQKYTWIPQETDSFHVEQAPHFIQVSPTSTM